MSPRKRQRTVIPAAQKPPTIREVAEKADVSTATVSRVLSGQQVVSDELVERVRDAVTSLEYRPNRTARSLRRRAAQIVGLVVSDVEDPFYTRLARGVEQALEPAQYTFVICGCGNDPDREMMHLSTLRSEGVAGIILAPTRSLSDALRQFTRIGPPTVTIDRVIDRALVDSVKVDNIAAGLALTSYLLQKGHQRIAFIGGLDQVNTCWERKEGYRRALEAAGLAVDDRYVCPADFRAAGAKQEMLGMLGIDPPPTAVIAGNHLMALGILEAIRESGKKVPDDLAVASFDDPLWAAALNPPLTVIDLPALEMGETAAQLLLERIDNPRQPVRQVVLDTKLIARESA